MARLLESRLWSNGPGKFSQRLNDAKITDLIKASAGRMYSVPEGHHDRSLARSAWEGAH